MTMDQAVFASAERVRDELYHYVSSSIGRAAVSKTAGWGFESLLTCDMTERGEDSLAKIGGRKIIHLGKIADG